MKLQLVVLAAAAVLVGWAAGRDPFEETRRTGYGIAGAPAPEQHLWRKNSTVISFNEKVVLIATDAFSLLQSFSPIVIRYHTGSWFLTRNIFSAKSVIRNFSAAAVWTIYMKIQMYLSSGYIGLDAFVVNCIALVLCTTVLICYFIKGNEFIKFAVCLLASVVLAISLIVIVVLYQTSNPTDHEIAFMNWLSNITAISGMVVFTVLSLMPFYDLYEMSRGKEDQENVTLNWPILLCTLLTCFVSFLWTFYAWVFPADAPNYFMIANLIAAVLSLIQCFWLGVICLHHRKVEGQIMDVESLRMSFLILSETLKQMAELQVEHSSWNRVGFFKDLADHVLNGAQSLSQIKLACQNQVRELQEMAASAVSRQANISDTATTLANNAISIVKAADQAANRGIEAANTARLEKQRESAFKAFEQASAALQSKGLPALLATEQDNTVPAAPSLPAATGSQSVPAAPPSLPATTGAQQSALLATEQDKTVALSRPATTGAQQPALAATEQDNKVAPPLPAATGARQSLSSSELELSKTLQEKAVEAISMSSSQLVEAAMARATEIDATTAVGSYQDLIAACDMCISVFNDTITAINKIIADGHERLPNLAENDAKTLQKVRIQALITAIKACPPRLKFLASRVRSDIEVINATTGIPAPMREGLRQTYDKMTVLNIAVDSLLFLIGLEKKLKWLVCNPEPMQEPR